MATGYILCLRDKTTCGGMIIGGNPHRRSHERPVARMGDPVTCGRHEGTYKIIGGISFIKDIEGNSQKLVAGTLDSFSSCPCRARFIVAKYPAMKYESRREVETPSAEASTNHIDPNPAVVSVEEKIVLPVFAKSILRDSGNTDAGTSEEPQDNIGEMSFYQSQSTQPVSEPEQHAQSAKKKTPPPPPPEPPKKKSLFDKVTGFFFGEAEAMPLPPPPVVMGGSAEAGMAATAGGASAKANQDAAKALTHTMKHLSGPEIWSGSLAMNLPFVVMGAIVQSKLKGEKSDLLTAQKLLEVAHRKGTVPTRVRYSWITDDETGRLKAVGYHTSAESGRDQVRVRMLEQQSDDRYEFWDDGESHKPLITWTPAATPGSQNGWNTGNDNPQAGTVTIPGLEHPDIQGVTITTSPLPEEKDFRDYILVFPGNIHPPIYIYLSKPPVELLEVELYKDFKDRSRQGKYEADHIPSAAAVIAHYKRLYPDAKDTELEKMAKNVAAIIVPKEVHRQISETFGGRNKQEQITRDSRDLKSAVESNFSAIEPALNEHGATEKQLSEAKTKIHGLNESVGLYDK